MHINATGLWLRFASPRAIKPAVRSSSTTKVLNLVLFEAARVSGADREPGEITTEAIPKRAKTSIATAPHAVLTLERAFLSKRLCLEVFTSRKLKTV